MLEPEVGKPPVALFGRTAWRAFLRSDESGTEDVVGRAGHVYYMLQSQFFVLAMLIAQAEFPVTCF
jgi:hypothetical protein